jgi:hypothetical protein
MSQDEIGLQYFTADQRPGGTPAPSVFGKVDQAEMISRIDSVEEDDLHSTFFGDSMEDVEDAATRLFDVGIRTITHESRPVDAPAFGTSSVAAATTSASASGVAPSAAPSGDDLENDERVRRAFILGGPAGLST